ncbi:hypothetical protein BS47DRAFT_1293115 [Hydnum rufescens UP504]|uniref:Cytochrome b-c1 complex subunit 8 n=1 Tax=Hydnum rufescens UP504 TaxID=1448309 RepID=A0A9P6B4A8_9AGAM|nr:hypothetical protein BS47DRAFT_1293115 [Hydnum rufescens UP504]
MGWWGDMGGPKQKGITSYTISPFRQRAMKGVLTGYIFNGYARIISQAPYFFVPLALGYGTYVWANKTDHYNNSKAGHIAAGEHH